MTDLGKLLTKRLGTDLARNAKVTVSEERKAGAARNYVATNLTDDNKDTYWAPNDGTTTATITLQWDEPQTVRYTETGFQAKYLRVKITNSKACPLLHTLSVY